MKTLGLLGMVLVALLGLAAYAEWLRLEEPFQGYAGSEQFVEILPGASTRAIGDRLVAAGVIRDGITYRIALWLKGDARRLQAGEYRFAGPMRAREVLGMIARGDVDRVAITFPEGLTIAEMARIFESHGLGPASAFVEAAGKGDIVRAVDPLATDLEGYVFPATYAVSRHIDAPQLVRAMVARFDQALTADVRDAAATRGLTVRQLVTLASIVEKETARAEERPLVAAVYANRLRVGMPLQCDPTVIYALSRKGVFDGNLRRDDLAVDSPYNTYRYPGLPPGPIAAPGKASLEAAAHPADAPFLYFVSRNDGSHEFARSLAEHNRNVQKFQVQHFRARGRGGR